MKTTFVVIALLAGTYHVQAQPVSQILAENRLPDDETDDIVYSERDVIPGNELPIAIKERLKSSDFRTLAVTKAYRKVHHGKTFYAVDISNGVERKKLKFDMHGIILNDRDLKLLLLQQL